MRTIFQQGTLGARMLWNLPSFLKRPIPLQQAQEIISNRLGNRERDFLLLLKTCIFDRTQNPYAKLLKMAGLEYEDARKLVDKSGVEGALHVFFHNGVYLTSQEFQGRVDVVRGSSRFTLKPHQLRNPLARCHVPIKSSGSRSKGTTVAMDLAFIRDCAVDTMLHLNACQSLAAAKANWEVPGGAALLRILTLSCSTIPPTRWFSQLHTHSIKRGIKYQASAWILKFGSALSRIPLSQPEHVSLEDPLPIVRWMQACLDKGQIPHLFTFASSAVRLCCCAFEAGIDLKGAYITMSGEPTTAARLASVERCHVKGVPAMGSAECGWIGYGCLAPNAPDDMHLLTDLHAVIQPGDILKTENLKNRGNTPKIEKSSGLKTGSLLLSSLRLSAPLVMLNVSLGDEAHLETRACGCPWEVHGLQTHIKYVRSFEKLTSGGTALLDTDVVKILEEVLPKRYGGVPTDYQLIEDEHQDGEPRLRLVIHPALGKLDNDRVKQTFLDALDASAEKIAASIWNVKERLSIERSQPRTTSTGKIQHMHLERSKKKSSV